MFKITSCSASCFPEECHYCQLFHKTNKPVNEIYPPPSFQWKHWKTGLLTSFLLLTGTTFVALRGVKIRNTKRGLQRLLFRAPESFPVYCWFRGLPNGRSCVFSYESFFMNQLGDSAGQACWQGRAGPAKGKAHPSHRLQAHYPHKVLPIKVRAVEDSFNCSRLIKTPRNLQLIQLIQPNSAGMAITGFHYKLHSPLNWWEGSIPTQNIKRVKIKLRNQNCNLPKA